MEIIDVLRPDGDPAGITKPKALVHRDGDWHRAVHVWIVQSDGRIVVQRRALAKENNPGLWDVSAAGHISAGESAIDAAIRETREELGLELDPAELDHVATLREQSVLNGGTYIDNEIHEIFVVRRDVDVRTLRLQKEEVDEARVVSWDEFAQLERVAHEEEYAMLRDSRFGMRDS
jgi:isopentenyldiphosphate isomerase